MNDQQQAIANKLKLNLKKKTRKGWMITDCPFCGKTAKFGVRFNDDPKYTRFNKEGYKNKVSFNCYSGSCGESGATTKLLIKLGLDYLRGQKDFVEDFKKRKLNVEVEDVLDLETEKRRPPVGYKRITSNKYLEDRKYEPWQFEQYQIGESHLLGMSGRVVFLIIEEGQCVGWLGRATYDSPIKYKNDQATFEKLLGGIDEIKEGDEVILVEGVTDKGEVDRKIKRLELTGIKCVCTFGKKISEIQLMKLRVRGVKKITFLWDDDATDEIKRYSKEAEEYIEIVKIGYIQEGDPDEISDEEFVEIMTNLYDVNEFSTNIVKRRKLR